MKIFYRKISAIACVLLPVALFFVTREKLSWRPQKIAVFAKNSSFAISPDERLIATASAAEKAEIVVRHLESGQKITSYQSNHEVSCLKFSADGRQLAWAWSITTEHELQNSTKRIGVALWDFKGKAREFEKVKGELVFDSPTQLRFSPDGKTLWMASSDNLRAWNIRSGKLKWQWREGDMGRDSSFPFVSVLSEDCQVYFRSDSDGYSVWDVKTKKRILRSRLPFLTDENPEFSDDASLATYYSDTITRGICYPVFETRTARILWCSSGVSPLTLVGDKAIRQQSNNLEILDARDGKLLRTLPAVPKTYVLPFVSSKWLYSIDHSYQTLFRQRLK